MVRRRCGAILPGCMGLIRLAYGLYTRSPERIRGGGRGVGALSVQLCKLSPLFSMQNGTERFSDTLFWANKGNSQRLGP